MKFFKFFFMSAGFFFIWQACWAYTVKIEAESVTPAGSWKKSTAVIGYSGESYLQWTGQNVYSVSGILSTNVLNYTFNLPAEGEYIITIRNRRDLADCPCEDSDCNDECNDMWLRVNGEPWIKKMSSGNWGVWSSDSGWQFNEHPTVISRAEAYFKAGSNTLSVSGRSAGVKFDYVELQTAPKYANGDLLSIHYDFAADPDDALASAADKTVASELGLNPVVVSGSHGWQADVSRTCPVCGKIGYLSNQYVVESEALMDIIWGAGKWYNAHSNRAASITSVANLWLPVLKNGGTVWVIESGQSDFTVEVVKKIRALGFTDTKNKIRVIQHSRWNEEYTEIDTTTFNEGLDYLRANTVYVKIGEGNKVLDNDGDNDLSADRPTHTADLNEKNMDWIIPLAEASPKYGTIWRAAFEFFLPRRADHSGAAVDFSDTVELLYALGIPVSKVSNVTDFFDTYVFNTKPPQDTTAPVINSISASKKASTESLLSWSVTDSGGSHLASIKVFRALDSKGTPAATWKELTNEEVVFTANVDSDDRTIDDIVASSAIYWYKIKVFDKAGNITESLPVKVDLTAVNAPPPAPEGLIIK